MPVYLGDTGKVLLGSDGKVATSSGCCCGGTGCCDILQPFTTLTLSGTITGCAAGSGSMGSVAFTRVAAPFGCDLDHLQWSKDSNCGCQFNAQNCVPFIEAGEIHSDNTNESCDDPDYGLCQVIAVIDCTNRNVQFQVGSSGTPSSPCCTTADTAASGFFSIPSSAGSISVSFSGSSLTFHVNLAFA